MDKEEQILSMPQEKLPTNNNQENEGSNNEEFTDYGDPNYWQERYKKSKGQRYQWLQGIDTLKQMLEQQLQHDKSKMILNIGCGNAQIQDHLYELGYTNIYNNDISKVVIEEMQAKRKQKNYHNMIYEVMDVCNMAYKDKSFDMVLDKSTIDALLCSEKPITSVALMTKQVYRVLKDGGIYFVVSYGSPFTRKQHLQRPHTSFSIKIRQIAKQCEQNGGKILHYAYICKKQKLNEQFQKNYQQKFAQLFNQLEKKQEEEYS